MISIITKICVYNEINLSILFLFHFDFISLQFNINNKKLKNDQLIIIKRMSIEVNKQNQLKW